MTFLGKSGRVEIGVSYATKTTETEKNLELDFVASVPGAFDCGGGGDVYGLERGEEE